MKNRLRFFFAPSLHQPLRTSGWLFFFRINIAGFALLHFLSIQPDFADLYSYQGYLYPDIIDASFDHKSFTITSLQAALQHAHINIAYETLLLVCRISYPFFLILLCCGFLTRFSVIASLFFQLLFIKSIHFFQYGVDGYTTIALWFCCIFPVGKIKSIDNLIFANRKPPQFEQIWLGLLRAHLSLAYFFSGFDKILGETWRNGEALWKALHSHNYYSLFKLDFLATTPFFVISCWITMLLEMLYPLFMNLPYTRRYWLWGIITLHIVIAFFMGLFFFSALLIILNLSAYYAPYMNIGKKKSKHPEI